MMMRVKLRHNNRPRRGLISGPKKSLGINPILHRPPPQRIKIPTNLPIIEVRLRHSMSLDPIKSNHINTPRASERLRKHIKTMINMGLVQLRTGAWSFLRLVVVRV